MVIFKCLNPEKITCFHVYISKLCQETNINCAFYATTQVPAPTNRYRVLESKIKDFYTTEPFAKPSKVDDFIPLNG